jgi:hypothetical protein
MRILFDENVPNKLVEGLISLTPLVSNQEIIISSVKLLNKTGTPDDKVLELVGKDGILITYDKDFKTQQHLFPIIKEYNIGVFFIRQPKIKTFWLLVKLIIEHWERLLEVAEVTDKPFIFEVTKTGVERRSY